MRDALREPFLAVSKAAYQRVFRPMLFRQDAQTAHETALKVMGVFDAHPGLMRLIHKTAFVSCPVMVGGVTLDSPLMLAAGMVKGHGFESENDAIAAVEQGENIMPGWRSFPALLGAVEFGSFTRYPRPGNPGRVMWRHPQTQSTQNRVGLKNPGAAAAAAFLSRSIQDMPATYGINIAVSPGVTDPEQELSEVREAVEIFLKSGLRPSWVTLNVSCPNTEDDPGDHQTEARIRTLCRTLVTALHPIPLWVKISPDLADSQFATLMRVFADEGVKAVVASNTLSCPTPDDPSLVAGVGGGDLYSHALRAATALIEQKRRHNYDVDVIGCGGVQDAKHFHAYMQAGVSAVQYWSGLVYRGPLMGAYILSEYVGSRSQSPR